MASIYQLEPSTLFTVPTTDTVTQCKLCHLPAVPYPDKPDIKLGPLYQYGKPVTLEDGTTDLEVYCAHYFCLLFSPGLKTNGGDEEGIRGFLPDDILKEWRRGARLKCQFCDKKYATVGCCIGKNCRKTYHLPCGLLNGAHSEFTEGFQSFCRNHRPIQSIYSTAEPDYLEKPRECGICLDDLPTISDLDEDERRKFIFSPCCQNWFHITCAERAAETAGYFFKCPLCNNKEVFEEEMKKFGVYVPEQDAAWELEGDQFEDLLERHDRCDAEACVCPNGRHEDVDYTIWEIILCRFCGSQGIHVQCGNLELVDDVTWKCPGCVEVVKKLPPTTKHHFRRTRTTAKKTSAIINLKNTLENLRFTVSGDTLSFNIKSDKFSFEHFGKYDVPIAVQVYKKIGNSEKEVEISEKIEETEATSSKVSVSEEKNVGKGEKSSVTSYEKVAKKKETKKNKKQLRGGKQPADENDNKVRQSLCKDENLKSIEIGVETPSFERSTVHQREGEHDVAVIYDAKSTLKNDSLKKKFDKKTNTLEEPFPGKRVLCKRKSNENFENEAPKKKLKLSASSSKKNGEITMKGSKPPQTPSGGQNQKTILHYFFLASSPPTGRLNLSS